MLNFWNQRYGAEAYAYGTEPNEFFRQQLALLTPGRLLLPAEGEGRNAVYAASRGFDAHAFDQSVAGQQKAMALAAQREVRISYEVGDAMEMAAAYAPGSFDAIALIYVHLPAHMRQPFHRALQRLLRSGGTLLLEGFSGDQLGRASGGPREAAMLFDVAMLRQDFDDLDIAMLEACETTLHEGPFHEGEAAVVRLVGTKRG